MLNLITLIILLISVLGMAVIALRKIPVLSELSPVEIKKTGVLEKIRNKIRENGFNEKFSKYKEVLLHRVLSKFRVLSMKAENKTADWLRELRQKSIEKKKSFQDDYWKKLMRKR